MLTIDGSQGEGGGQILRSSLSLSIISGKPFRIINIRAGRKKPGLMRQHLTAVKAAAQISGAKLSGAEIGSLELTFSPGEVVPGEYHFSIGTAGSTTLVLQTVLPPLLNAPAPSRLILEGGTHNLAAPPFDFLKKTFLPILNRMGPQVKVSLQRPGFYPAGGGKFTADIQPANKFSPVDILARGEIISRNAVAMVSNLPLQIAERELKTVQGYLNFDTSELSAIEIKNARGPGNVVNVEIQSEHITEVFTGFGEKGVRAEAVATRVAEKVRRYLAAEVPVAAYLADQLLLPFALAGSGSFLTFELTPHSLTNIDIIKQFLDIQISVENISKNNRLVKIN